MRLLKISICSVAILILSIQNSYGKYISASVGIFDFTSEIARDFYVVSPMAMFTANILEFDRVQILVSTGASFRKLQYNNNWHTVMMFPLNTTLLYNLPNLGSKLRPYFGAGIGAVAKYDKNDRLEEPHTANTYGYNLLFGFSYRLSSRYALGMNLQYLLYSPPVVESINVSGIYTALELRYQLGTLRPNP